MYPVTKSHHPAHISPPPEVDIDKAAYSWVKNIRDAVVAGNSQELK